MAEVSLNHVGMVLGLELSRLSRNNKDWHQLVDVCAAGRGMRVGVALHVDVSSVVTATSLLGCDAALPLAIAPMAGQRMVHPEGELAMARNRSLIPASLISLPDSTVSRAWARAGPTGAHTRGRARRIRRRAEQ